MVSDLSLLFEEAPTTSYPSWEEELRAVAQGTKAISWYSSTAQVAENGAEGLSELYELAYSSGLSVIVRPAEQELQIPTNDRVDIFFLRTREAWRTEALIAVLKAKWKYGCSDAVEYLVSQILGYDSESCRIWLDWKQKERLGWVGQTVYLVLTDSETAALESTGMRFFPQDLDERQLDVFHAQSGWAPRDNVGKLLGKGSNLCRFALNNEFFIELFRCAESVGPLEIVRFEKDISNLNAAIVSEVSTLI